MQLLNFKFKSEQWLNTTHSYSKVNDKNFLISIISSVFLIGLVGVVPVNLSQNVYAIKTGNCKILDSLWEHTYGAGKSHWSHAQTYSRLKPLLPACIIFEGVVRGTPSDPEGDGDLHINLTPDGTKGNDNFALLNQYNTKGLVAEVICWDTPNYNKYSNFQGRFCDGVNPHGHIPILNQGDHVRVTGKWVQDVGYPNPTHPQWNEIHPVESIEKLK
jgi:hypothetical protein